MIDSPPHADTTMVNLYMAQLRELNPKKNMDDVLGKLQKWRFNSLEVIEECYKKKLDEIDHCVKKLNDCQKNLEDIQQSLSQINDASNTNDNQNKTELYCETANKLLLDIKNLMFNIDAKQVSLEDSVQIIKSFDIDQLSNEPLKFDYTPRCSSAMASSDTYILIHLYPRLCLLDRSLKIVRQTLWTYEWIRDMCWSSTLNRFIVLTNNNCYFVDEMLAIRNSHSSEICMKQNWFSCTCSKEFLYLSTFEWATSIYEWNLTNPLTPKQQWTSPTTCDTNEGIVDIKYNNDKIALIIKNAETDTNRMCLKLAKTFESIWSLDLSRIKSIHLITCSALNFNEWLVIDGTDRRLYHISYDGNFKKNCLHSSVPYRANLFYPNVLALADEHSINFIKLNN